MRYLESGGEYDKKQIKCLDIEKMCLSLQTRSSSTEIVH